MIETLRDCVNQQHLQGEGSEARREGHPAQGTGRRVRARRGDRSAVLGLERGRGAGGPSLEQKRNQRRQKRETDRDRIGRPHPHSIGKPECARRAARGRTQRIDCIETSADAAKRSHVTHAGGGEQRKAAAQQDRRRQHDCDRQNELDQDEYGWRLGKMRIQERVQGVVGPEGQRHGERQQRGKGFDQRIGE